MLKRTSSEFLFCMARFPMNNGAKMELRKFLSSQLLPVPV